MSYIFVSSPYTHEDKKISQLRFEQVTKYVATLVSEGITAFSPITFGHTLVQFVDMPTDFEFWDNFCYSFLSKCTEMHVLMLEGFELSTGVKGEIKYCEENNIPIKYIKFFD